MSEFGKVAVLMGRARHGAAEQPVREGEAAAHRLGVGAVWTEDA
jgi:hypothetical protein